MNNLKLLRKQRKLTQNEIAKAIKTSQQNYSRYETGKVQADYATLSKLANFFAVSTDFLLINYNLEKYKKNDLGALINFFTVPIYQKIFYDSNNTLVTKEFGQTVVELPSSDNNNFFYFFVNDNSMRLARIQAGDLVLCYITKQYKNNELVIACYNNKTILARYKIIDEIAILMNDDVNLIPTNENTKIKIIAKIIKLEVNF